MGFYEKITNGHRVYGGSLRGICHRAMDGGQ
jgi:hypothetical protein